MIIVLLLLTNIAFADNFLLDQERVKNPSIFNAKPESLTKEELTYRVKADERGLEEYTKKISTLKQSISKLRRGMASLTTENKSLKNDRDAYMEKIEKLSSRLAEFENIVTKEPNEQTDIHGAYKKLQQDYKRLELSSALKGGEGYQLLLLEKENRMLKSELDRFIRESGGKRSPKVFVEKVGTVN